MAPSLTSAVLFYHVCTDGHRNVRSSRIPICVKQINRNMILNISLLLNRMLKNAKELVAMNTVLRVEKKTELQDFVYKKTNLNI